MSIEILEKVYVVKSVPQAGRRIVFGRTATGWRHSAAFRCGRRLDCEDYAAKLRRLGYTQADR